MFGKSKTNNTGAPSTPLKKVTPSVISADMNVLGNIISEGFLDINGRIEGNVKCDHAVIRENGKVKGDVVAQTVQIYGEVEGLVKAKHVNLYATAHVAGVIMHESLSIEDGAFVDGKFKRTDKVFIDDAGEQSDANTGESEEESRILDNLRLISG
jgi:cytoskeletal protein CcmA (bactofilin family)